MSFKVSVIVGCVALGLLGVAPKSCGSNGGGGAGQNANAGVNANANVGADVNTNTVPPGSATPTPATGGGVALRVLAEGQYGEVEEPFLVVARDAAVYGMLRELVRELPEVGSDFFASQAAVAAFLGTRNSGGYGVEISRAGGGPLVVTERRPPPGSMTTMALTQPYRVVAVPVGGDQPVEVEWAGTRFASYRVTSGEFEMSGGIAGRVEKFALEGTFAAARRAGLVTFVFELRGVGGSRQRVLKGAASGVVQSDGSFSLTNVDAGTLVERPRSPLRITGRWAEGGAALTLVFESQPATVADGFGGRGRLEAAPTGKD